MRRFLGLLLVLGSVLLVPAPAQACSCAALTPEEYAENADVVVVGTIVDVERPSPIPVLGSDEVTYRVEVAAVHKGEVTEAIEVVTAASDATCGLFPMAPGQRTVLFLQTHDGRLTGSLCGGTGVVTEDEVSALLPPVSGQPTPGRPDEAPPAAVRAAAGVGAGLVVVGGVTVLARRTLRSRRRLRRRRP